MTPKRAAAKRKAVPEALRHSRRVAAGLVHANRNIREAGALAATAGRVVNARLTGLKPAEFARMAPEKMIAAGASGAASATVAMKVVAQLYKDAAGEGIAAFALMQKIARARTPGELMALQQDAVCAAWDRMIARTFSMGEIMLRAQGAVSAPYRTAANANARRLSTST